MTFPPSCALFGALSGRAPAARRIRSTPRHTTATAVMALIAAIAVIAAIVAEPGAAQQPQLPFDFDADSVDIDLQANLFTVERLRSVRGGLSIEADQALAPLVDSNDSEWRLTGNVRLATETGAIEADEAVGSDLDAPEWRLTGNVRVSFGGAVISADSAGFLFEARRLARVELTGAPATFEASDAERDGPIRGSANRLEYDEATGTLRMLDDAWLSEGPNEFRGCDLVYDFARERVTSGTSDCGERVRIRIQPPSGDADDPAASQ